MRLVCCFCVFDCCFFNFWGLAAKIFIFLTGVEFNRSSAHIFIDNVDCETSGVSIGSETRFISRKISENLYN